MTDTVVYFRKAEIDRIVDNVDKNDFISVQGARWRLVMMASSINRDAITGLMTPQEGVTEDERISLQEYNRSAFERLRV